MNSHKVKSFPPPTDLKNYNMLIMLLCNTDLPHAGFFAVHNSHIVDLVPLNAQSLCLIQLLRHKTHKRVVWGVGCQGQTTRLAIQSYKSNFMS